MNPLLPAKSAANVFPPALVPVLRDRLSQRGRNLEDVPNDVLVELLTTIFWAGLETYEGERNAIGVAFLGTSAADFITHDGGGFGAAPPIYEWKILRFESPRPFATSELVKLAVAGVDHQIYSAVSLRDGRLAISGLAREGFDLEADHFFKIIASRPGSMSIRCGRDLLLGYEHGAILTGGEEVVFLAGPVRLGLEAAARAAGLDDDIVPDYVDAVRALVREMAAHGRGGILIISFEESPKVVEGVPYRMALDSSLASLIRLARRLHRTKSHGRASRSPGPGKTKTPDSEPAGSEVNHIAFGVVLPLERPTMVAKAMNGEGHSRIIDLGSRGTRHRAAVSYAAEHPGSVVFVASEDGLISCVFRDSSDEHPALWRLGPDIRVV